MHVTRARPCGRRRRPFRTSPSGRRPAAGSSRPCSPSRSRRGRRCSSATTRTSPSRRSRPAAGSRWRRPGTVPRRGFGPERARPTRGDPALRVRNGRRSRGPGFDSRQPERAEKLYLQSRITQYRHRRDGILARDDVGENRGNLHQSNMSLRARCQRRPHGGANPPHRHPPQPRSCEFIRVRLLHHPTIPRDLKWDALALDLELRSSQASGPTSPIDQHVDCPRPSGNSETLQSSCNICDRGHQRTCS